jgi:V/A-type H+-transporting ATPase subunit D
VQIPAYEEAIRKIKRFLEDKENIATAAKKIAKKRSQAVT